MRALVNSHSRRVARVFAALGLMLLVAAFSATVATADEFRPDDFDVNIEMGPDQGQGDADEPSCTVNPDLTQTCTAEQDVSQQDRRASGTVRHITSGLEGTIETICDFDMHSRFSFVMSMPTDPGLPPEMTVLDVSGSARMRCAWHMSYDDGSSLTGRIAGSMTMQLIDAATGRVRMTDSFTVDVVHGSGHFAGLVGSGTFGHSEEFELFGPDGPEGPGDGPGGESRRTARAAASVGTRAEGSAMNLKLRKGAARASIVSPDSRIKRKDRAALQVVTAPGSKCRATATKSGKRVSLGAARAKSNGNAAFRGAVGAKLKSGKWTLKANCRTGKGTASASEVVSVK